MGDLAGQTIGTLDVVDYSVQGLSSTYQVKVGSQSYLIKINGNATINGGTVAVQSVDGARPTTYTIVTATSGVTGTCSGLTSNFAFVTPPFFYDANTVFLALRTSFAGGRGTGKIEVDGALDRCADRRL